MQLPCQPNRSPFKMSAIPYSNSEFEYEFDLHLHIPQKTWLFVCHVRPIPSLPPNPPENFSANVYFGALQQLSSSSSSTVDTPLLPVPQQLQSNLQIFIWAISLQRAKHENQLIFSKMLASSSSSTNKKKNKKQKPKKKKIEKIKLRIPKEKRKATRA